METGMKTPQSHVIYSNFCKLLELSEILENDLVLDRSYLTVTFIKCSLRTVTDVFFRFMSVLYLCKSYV